MPTIICPEFTGLPCAEVNLNDEAKRWLDRKNITLASDECSPFLVPATCQAMIDEVHRRVGSVWSYGGWMENRGILWKGLPYLEEARKLIHVGVDVNVPAGTRIAATQTSRVLHIDDDGDAEGGWGPRIIVELLETDRALCLMYAHLQNVRVNVGQVLRSGDLLAHVGTSPHNGGWYDHVHAQALELSYFLQLKETRQLEDPHYLDGYCTAAYANEAAIVYPDPTPYLFPEGHLSRHRGDPQ